MDTTRLSQGQLNEYTYRRPNIVDYTLDDADLETHCPLDSGQYSIQPQYSLGQLDTLPLEIVIDILLTLDIPSLTAFRHVNRRAMGLVHSLHQYRMVVKHCPNVLRAIISIDARYFNLRTLYNTLSTSRCETCYRFGGYLYLITCKRVCYFCFTSNPIYLPISVGFAAKHTGLSRKLIKNLAHILSIPGRYTAFGKLSRKRIMLFDRQAIFERAVETSTQALNGRSRQQDYTTREPRRYMSIISAPFFGSPGQSVDWGFYCAGCRESTQPTRHFRDKFTENGIVDHIRRYGAITVANHQMKHG